MRIEGQVFVNM